MKRYIVAIVVALSFAFAPSAYALRDSRPLPTDNRIHSIVYNPDDVFKFTGHYGFQSSIVFEEGEEVDTISMGDSVAWQIVTSGNRIFLKPMEQDATTNMTVITNRRVYQFELHAKAAGDNGINADDMIFVLRFTYPDEQPSGIQNVSNAPLKIDLSEPGKYNFNYSISGPEQVAPIKIFDDGEFTYFEFRDKNAEVPAFFLVDSEANESLVNYRVVDGYIVLERVASRLTLRHGGDVVCVFNEGMPYYRKKEKKKFFFF